MRNQCKRRTCATPEICGSSLVSPIGVGITLWCLHHIMKYFLYYLWAFHVSFNWICLAFLPSEGDKVQSAVVASSCRWAAVVASRRQSILHFHKSSAVIKEHQTRKAISTAVTHVPLCGFHENGCSSTVFTDQRSKICEYSTAPPFNCGILCGVMPWRQCVTLHKCRSASRGLHDCNVAQSSMCKRLMEHD